MLSKARIRTGAANSIHFVYESRPFQDALCLFARPTKRAVKAPRNLFPKWSGGVLRCSPSKSSDPPLSRRPRMQTARDGKGGMETTRALLCCCRSSSTAMAIACSFRRKRMETKVPSCSKGGGTPSDFSHTPNNHGKASKWLATGEHGVDESEGTDII